MASIRQRHNKWHAKLSVPKAHQETVGVKELYRTLKALDKKGAQLEADLWEATVKTGWRSAAQPETPSALREIYQRALAEATDGTLAVHSDAPEGDPMEQGIAHEIDRIAEEVGAEGEPTREQAMRLAALQDAATIHQGGTVAHRKELELSFSELAEQYMTQWRSDASLKHTNTEQQKRATFRLFTGYWKDAPIRGVRQADATAFFDIVRTFRPSWARSPAGQTMAWQELAKAYAGDAKGLSAATMNRHAQALSAFWSWAGRRGHCDGFNPFEGNTVKLTAGRVRSYVEWSDEELTALLWPAPARSELTEIILVALHTGMRLNEIAALTWGDIKSDGDVDYFDVREAKTEAGNRQVPIHPALRWLTQRTAGAPSSRIWSTFNPEGPGGKPGADAGRLFTAHKQARGFTDPRKVFHSFRKNVTSIMERAGVPENEWAEVVGHAKGFTYGTYGSGIALKRKKEIIELIAYPEIALPEV